MGTRYLLTKTKSVKQRLLTKLKLIENKGKIIVAQKKRSKIKSFTAKSEYARTP